MFVLPCLRLILKTHGEFGGKLHVASLVLFRGTANGGLGMGIKCWKNGDKKFRIEWKEDGDELSEQMKWIMGIMPGGGRKCKLYVIDEILWGVDKYACEKNKKVKLATTKNK